MITANVPTQDGTWVTRTTGTRDAGTAKKMQRMLDDLGPRGARAWDVLNRVVTKQLSVPALFDLWTANNQDLNPLRAKLDDVDIEPYVEKWHTALTGPSGGIAKDTADHYLAAVRSLIDEGKVFRRSEFTTKRLGDWIEGITDITPSTVRKHGQGMRRFSRWLVAKHVLSTDPMIGIALPAAGRPRVQYLESVDAKRLADAQPAPFNAFSALLAGSGIEVSVALTLRRRDVDKKNREIRAAGTKTHARDRIIRVAEWAWDYLEPLLEDKHSDALIFDGIPHRWAPRDAHADAIAALIERGHEIYRGYTMRDQRHTYAVRAIRAGTPAELVARQLGHVDGVLVLRVYGRFSPKQDERDKWEKIAAAQDVAAEEESKKQGAEK